MKHNIFVMTLQIIPSIDCTIVNRLSSIYFSCEEEFSDNLKCVCESAERVNQFLKGVGKVWLK